MRRSLLIPAVCLALSIGCQNNSAVTEKAENPQQGIKTTKTNSISKSFYSMHDFGVHDPGQEVPASVELKNDSDKPVRFGFANASCGCVTIKAIPKEIAPGESGTFVFSLRTDGLKGRHVYRLQAWDTEPRTILAVIEAGVLVRSIETIPHTIPLGDISLHAVFEKDLFVTVAGYPAAKIVSAETDASWLSTELQGASTAENLKDQGVQAIGSYKVKWTGKGAAPGPLAAKIAIEVKLDDEREETLTIPVSGYLRGLMESVPSHIVFSSLKKNSASERTCVLAFNESKPDIAAVTCVTDHDFVTAQVKKAGTANQWELTTTAKLPDNSTAGLIQGQIVGKDASGKVIFSVPYSAYLGAN